MSAHIDDDVVIAEMRTAGRITVDDGPDRRLSGRAIPFNDWSKINLHPRLGRFRERIMPSAVDRTLKGPRDVKAFWNHDENIVLGSRKAGTLQLRKESSGLMVQIHPPKWASNYVETVERGDVDGMSFCFGVADPDWEEWDFRTADGIPLRTVHDMVFKEVSITPEPAYENAMVEISKRSVDIFLQYQQAPKSYDWRSKLHEINVIRFGQ